jgi:DNA-binding transcriptional LysR family regulator
MHAQVLRYLDEVVRRGSIRKAAEALHVASSAVNRQILKLEAEIGAPLFERRASGVRLTPAGEILARHARETLYAFSRSRASIDDLKGLKTGHVRIVALDSLMVDFLPGALEEFHRLYPGVSFSVMALGPSDVGEEVGSGEADIGVSFALGNTEQLRVIAKVPTAMHAMVAVGHPLARRRVVRLVDCARYPVALVHDTLPLTPLLEGEFARAGAEPVPLLRSNSIELLRYAVRAGLCVAFFTRLGFAREIAAKEVVAIPLAETRLSGIPLAVMVPARQRLSVAAAAVADHLARQLERLVKPGGALGPPPGRGRR